MVFEVSSGVCTPVYGKSNFCCSSDYGVQLPNSSHARSIPGSALTAANIQSQSRDSHSQPGKHFPVEEQCGGSNHAFSLDTYRDGNRAQEELTTGMKTGWKAWGKGGPKAESSRVEKKANLV